MIEPTGLEYDAGTKRLFAGDAGNERVLVFDLSSGITDGMNASHVLGQPDFITDTGGNATRSSFGFVSGLSYDSSQKLLFVADNRNNREMIFAVSAIVDGQDAIGVLGQPDFISNGNDCSTSSPIFCNLEGVEDAYDSTNRRLFLSDSGNNRVLVFEFARITTASLPNGRVGTHYSKTIAKAGTQGTVSFSLTAGALPTGLSLSSSTGIISGIPTTAGSYNFTIQVSDDNGDAGTYTDSKSYSVVISSGGSGGVSPEAVAAINAVTNSGEGAGSTISPTVSGDTIPTVTTPSPEAPKPSLNKLWYFLAGVFLLGGSVALFWELKKRRHHHR